MQPKQPFYHFPHHLPSWQSKLPLLHSLLASPSLNQSIQLLNQIKNTQSSYQPTWTLNSLLYPQSPTPQTTLPLLKYIVSKAMLIQKLFPNTIPLSTPLKEGQTRSQIVLTRMQCCCLVACMMLCLVEPQKECKRLPIYINWAKLSIRSNEINRVMLVYFTKIQKYQEQNRDFLSKSHIVYLRFSSNKSLSDFTTSQIPLSPFHFHTTGTIQNQLSSIQIDFANKSIGGFFLAHTFTQQDIIFINNPQNIPAMLFHEYMADNESLLLIGSQRVATYEGYLDTYKFGEVYEDEREFIKIEIGEGRYVENVRDHWISAIDAIPQFINNEFTVVPTLRELNKAYCGFHIQSIDHNIKSISTGNWGSGAFGGNLQYKFLIQWIAASLAGREIEYYAFGDKRADGIEEVVKMCEGMTVGELVKGVIEMGERFTVTRKVFEMVRKWVKDRKGKGEKGIEEVKEQEEDENKGEEKNEKKQNE